MFVQLFAGDDPAAVLREVLHKRQFAGSEKHRDAGFGDSVRSEVDQDIVDTDHG